MDLYARYRTKLQIYRGGQVDKLPVLVPILQEND